jgi:hypothetical protein
MKIALAWTLYYLGDFVSRFLNITNGAVYPLYNRLMLWSHDLDTEHRIWQPPRKEDHA